MQIASSVLHVGRGYVHLDFEHCLQLQLMPELLITYPQTPNPVQESAGLHNIVQIVMMLYYHPVALTVLRKLSFCASSTIASLVPVFFSHVAILTTYWISLCCRMTNK